MNAELAILVVVLLCGATIICSFIFGIWTIYFGPYRIGHPGYDLPLIGRIKGKY